MGIISGAYERRGIKVNEYLQSISNLRVYAARDVADSKGLPLTPIAVFEGHTVASNILKGNNKAPQYKEMPMAVFTSPPLASVGLAKKRPGRKTKTTK